MSEQELTKWKNKFKLWKILHYNVDLQRDTHLRQSCCEKCIHSLFTKGRCFRRCPDEILVYTKDETGEKIFNFDNTVVSPVHIDRQMTFVRQMGVCVCVEWIKYV